MVHLHILYRIVCEVFGASALYSNRTGYVKNHGVYGECNLTAAIASNKKQVPLPGGYYYLVDPKIDYSVFALFRTEVNKFEGIGILLTCIWSIWCK